jgi:hypothetical protein
VALGDGTVLVVGDDFDCQPGGAHPGSERAERYDPAADAWLDVQSLNNPRKTPATVVLRDGSAMVLGGVNANDVSFSSTKVFSPATGKWRDGPLLNLARGRPLAAALSDGRILVVSETSNRRASSEIYDPVSRAWLPTTSVPPTTGLEQIVALSDGRVLGTGYDGADSEPAPVAYVYDPRSNDWTRVDTPDQFEYALVALADGGALAIGGNDGGDLAGGTGAMVDRVSRFDPASGQWASVAPVPTIRFGAQVVGLADGRVLVAGGAEGRGANFDERDGPTLRSTEIYDSDANTWTAAGDLLEPRKDGYAVALDDGSALVLGGDDDYDTQGATPWCPTPLTSVERFTPGS